MPSIIPAAGSPGVAANVTSQVVIDHDTTIPFGQALYTTSLATLFGNVGLQTSRHDLTNYGEVWNIGSGAVCLLNVMNFGGIFNAGLLVANSTGSNAFTLTVSSTWLDDNLVPGGGLNNIGSIYALAPSGSAVAITDASSGATITNSNLIAAQGNVATAILRANGGNIVNAATGSILAEGADAVAIYMGRGRADIDNAGIIEAASTSSLGSVAIYIASLAGETTTIHNTGLIAALSGHKRWREQRHWQFWR